MQKSRLYLDHNATVPLAMEHFRALGEKLVDVDANPSSQHASGRRAKIALEEARMAVATLLGAEAPQIVFTSGATESNNLVIQGVVGGGRGAGGVLPHVVITAAEHPSVRDVVSLMRERELIDLDVVPVDRSGVVDREQLIRSLRADTALVCIIWANNEVGAINPVIELARQIRERASRVHIHIDAVQALGRLDIAVSGLCKLVDSAAFSGHKIGSLKGVGALFLKGGSKLRLLCAGGGQERGRRPGTENLPGIISLGLRCRDLAVERPWSTPSFTQARDRLLQRLAEIPGMVIHGEPHHGLANTVNFHVEGIAGDDLLINLDLAGLEAASGSACSSGLGRPSHVLQAMGYDEIVALNSVRVSFGARSGAEEADQVVKVLYETVTRIRSSAPGKVLEPRS